MIVPEEESFLPQWGIAVIVIALASLLFVVIFGVTVVRKSNLIHLSIYIIFYINRQNLHEPYLMFALSKILQLVNRQKSSKAKQPIPLSEEMLRDLDKSHMGGFDDLHQMKERDLPYLPPGKVIQRLLS